MKVPVRKLGLVAALVGSLGFGMMPASAAGAGVFEGTATINCFGCGDSAGTAALCVTGILVDVNNPPAHVVVGPSVCVAGVGLPPNVFATYTVHEDTGVGCVIQGTAVGTTTGAVNTSFTWTRLGAIALISTTGDINGSGLAAFVVTNAVGNPCGTTNLTAEVAGVLVGA